MRISVIIPTFRRPTLLQNLLCSIDDAKGKEEINIIIVDNIGDLTTEKICKKMSANFPTKYIVSPTIGKNTALNLGINASPSDYLIFFDDDIEISQNYFLDLQNLLNENPGIGVISGPVLLNKKDFKKWSSKFSPQLTNLISVWGLGLFDPYPESKLFEKKHYPLEANMIWRKDLLLNIGCFNESLGPRKGLYIMGTHGNLFKLARAKGEKIYFEKRLLVYHAIRPEQISMNWVIKRGFSYGRSLVVFDRKYREIYIADESISKTLRKIFDRAIKAVYFFLLRKKEWCEVAVVELALLCGVLYQKIRRQRIFP